MQNRPNINYLLTLCEHGIGLNECELAAAVPELLSYITQLEEQKLLRAKAAVFDFRDVMVCHGACGENICAECLQEAALVAAVDKLTEYGIRICK